MTAMLFLAYCAGNIAGPQLFIATEEPNYSTAFRAIMICYALVVALALTLRFYLQWTNKKRQAEEGIEGSAGASGAVGGGKIIEVTEGSGNVNEALGRIQLRPEDYDDVTDWNTYGFRYRL